MKSTNFRMILLGIVTLIVFVAPILPIVNMQWILPGEDADGNTIYTAVDNFYSVFRLIDEFSRGWPFFFVFLPPIYMLCTVMFTYLVGRRMFGYRVNLNKTVWWLAYPLLVGLLSLFCNVTIFGVIIFLAMILAIFALLVWQDLCFMGVKDKK